MEGEIVALLGKSGSGKSTLLRIMAGIDKEFVGDGFVAEGGAIRVASGGADKTLRVWDPTTGAALYKIEGHAANAWQAFSLSLTFNSV